MSERDISVSGPYPKCGCGGNFVPVHIDEDGFITWKCTDCGSTVSY